MGATSAETCMYGTCEQSEKETHRSLPDWLSGGGHCSTVFSTTLFIDRHNHCTVQLHSQHKSESNSEAAISRRFALRPNQGSLSVTGSQQNLQCWKHVESSVSNAHRLGASLAPRPVRPSCRSSLPPAVVLRSFHLLRWDLAHSLGRRSLSGP